MNGVSTRPTASPLVDAHCHIDLFASPAAVLREAEAAGIHTIAVTNAPSVFFHTRDLAKGCRYVHPAVGLHPQLAAERAAEVERMWPHLDETRFVGEVGLDYVTQDEANRRLQRDVFGRILERCARSGGKVITVHSRRAAKEVISAVGPAFPGTVILHWFSGTVAELERAVANGLHFSVNSAMTLSRSGQNLIARMPLERVLTETDGPFVQVGNEPARPPHTAAVVDYLAGVWGVSAEAARAVVSDNFSRLLGEGRQSSASLDSAS
jgi:TatD DNase family protein